MAIEPVQNDSVISVGLDAAETTEQSVGEIAASVDNEAGQTVAAEAQQSTPEQDRALQEARELAHAAREHEAQEFERVPELEQDGPGKIAFDRMARVSRRQRFGALMRGDKPFDHQGV